MLVCRPRCEAVEKCYNVGCNVMSLPLKLLISGVPCSLSRIFRSASNFANDPCGFFFVFFFGQVVSIDTVIERRCRRHGCPTPQNVPPDIDA